MLSNFFPNCKTTNSCQRRSYKIMRMNAYHPLRQYPSGLVVGLHRHFKKPKKKTKKTTELLNFHRLFWKLEFSNFGVFASVSIWITGLVVGLHGHFKKQKKKPNYFISTGYSGNWSSQILGSVTSGCG